MMRQEFCWRPTKSGFGMAGDGVDGCGLIEAPIYLDIPMPLDIYNHLDKKNSVHAHLQIEYIGTIRPFLCFNNK